MNTVVTRFAPSPTGFLHIGGARTALFNYLQAKRVGGKFLLRIEDTDLNRSTQESIDAIINGMAWLGIHHDGEIVTQSLNRTRHYAIAMQLLNAGKAYKCYLTAEETEAYKTQDKGFRSPFRESSESLNKPFSVRLKVPNEGVTLIQDEVQGEVVIDNRLIEDLVLLRSDGTPTYNLSVVVDDHDMGVNLIIRGDDHLINASKQQLITEAMGWTVPRFAHIPLIHNDLGQKLSKREGAAGLDYYAQMGYLPEAVLNYLCTLGWNPTYENEERIFFSLTEACLWFDIASVKSSPARIDYQRLNFYNQHYVKQLTSKTRLEQYLEFVSTYHQPLYAKLQTIEAKRLMALVDEYSLRAPHWSGLVEATEWFTTPVATATTWASLTSETKGYLKAFYATLSQEETFSQESLKQMLDGFLQTKGLVIKAIAPAIRQLLTGTTQAPSIPFLLWVLSKKEALKRLEVVLT